MSAAEKNGFINGFTQLSFVSVWKVVDCKVDIGIPKHKNASDHSVFQSLGQDRQALQQRRGGRLQRLAVLVWIAAVDRYLRGFRHRVRFPALETAPDLAPVEAIHGLRHQIAKEIADRRGNQIPPLRIWPRCNNNLAKCSASVFELRNVCCRFESRSRRRLLELEFSQALTSQKTR